MQPAISTQPATTRCNFYHLFSVDKSNGTALPLGSFADDPNQSGVENFLSAGDLVFSGSSLYLTAYKQSDFNPLTKTRNYLLQLDRNNGSVLGSNQLLSGANDVRDVFGLAVVNPMFGLGFIGNSNDPAVFTINPSNGSVSNVYSITPSGGGGPIIVPKPTGATFVPTGGPQPIPEPSTLALVICAAGVWLGWRSRLLLKA